MFARLKVYHDKIKNLHMMTIISVYCVSNIDCESLSETPVCKETIPGGAKTCQASSTCTQVCSSEEYCNAINICYYGMSIQQ